MSECSSRIIFSTSDSLDLHGSIRRLSYIISGKMTITPQETGVPVEVNAGDFVTFPAGFACFWHVMEVVTKHYYLY